MRLKRENDENISLFECLTSAVDLTSAHTVNTYPDFYYLVEMDLVAVGKQMVWIGASTRKHDYVFENCRLFCFVLHSVIPLKTRFP